MPHFVDFLAKICYKYILREVFSLVAFFADRHNKEEDIMKAKNLLKQLLLVTLVLCISLLGTTTAVFSEEQTDAPADTLPTICLYGFKDAEEYELWEYYLHSNLSEEIKIIDSFDFSEGEVVWLLASQVEPRSTSVLPEILPQELYFVNSTFIPSTLKIDEGTELWLEVILDLARKGQSIHLYSTPKVEPYDFYAAIVNRNVFDRIAELAEDPESGIVKSEEEDNLYIVATDDPEVFGYIRITISEGANIRSANATAIADLGNAYWPLLYPDLPLTP